MTEMHLATRHIERMIADGKPVPTGTFWLDHPIVVDHPNARIIGSGFETLLRPSGDWPAIIIGKHRDTVLRDFRILGGLHGIHVQGGSHIRGSDIKIEYCKSHGVLVEGGSWCNYWSGCQFKANGGSGYHSVRTATVHNGHNTAFAHCQFWKNKDNGLTWSANSLDVSGCLFECNGKNGLALTALGGSAVGVSVSGCHFESNALSQLFMQGTVGCAVSGVHVAGNLLFNSVTDTPLILTDGPPGTVRFVTLPLANEWYSRHGDVLVDMQQASRYCTVTFTSDSPKFLINDDNNTVTYAKAA